MASQDEEKLEDLQKKRDDAHSKSQISSKINVADLTKRKTEINGLLPEVEKEVQKELATTEEEFKAAQKEFDKFQGTYEKNRRNSRNYKTDPFQGPYLFDGFNKENYKKARERFDNIRLKRNEIRARVSSLRREKEDIDKQLAYADKHKESSKEVDSIGEAISKKLNAEKSELQAVFTKRDTLNSELTAINEKIKESEANLAKVRRNPILTRILGKSAEEKQAEIDHSNLTSDKYQKENEIKANVAACSIAQTKLDAVNKKIENERKRKEQIGKDRGATPDKVSTESLAQEISDIKNKSPQEREALIIKIKSTAPEILTAKTGQPPESLLEVASKAGAGKIGVELLESAQFPKEDMLKAIDAARVRRGQSVSKESELSAVKHSLKETFNAHENNVAVAHHVGAVKKQNQSHSR